MGILHRFISLTIKELNENLIKILNKYVRSNKERNNTRELKKVDNLSYLDNSVIKFLKCMENCLTLSL